jgi:nucleoside phosphorylase
MDFDFIKDIATKVKTFQSEVEHLEFKKEHSSFQRIEAPKFNDIVIICATQDEFISFKSILEDVQRLDISNDATLYYKGYIKGLKDKFSVIIPVPSDMGIATAAIVTTKCIHQFRPRFIFMVGIAAGIKASTKVGDVIIADQALNYNEVIEIENADQTTRTKYMHNVISISSNLRSRFYMFLNSSDINEVSEHSLLKDLNRGVRFHIGMMVSGGSLIRSKERIKQLVRDYHNIKGIDMETYGVYKAVYSFNYDNTPDFISIKSVSDFGDNDTHKEITDSDKRKELALFTATTTLKQFIKSQYFE